MSSAFFRRRTSKHAQLMSRRFGAFQSSRRSESKHRSAHKKVRPHDESSIRDDARIARDARPGSGSGLHAPAVERRAWAPEHVKTDGGHSRHYGSAAARPSDRDRAPRSLGWRTRAHRPFAPEHDHGNPPATHQKGPSPARARSTRQSTHSLALSGRGEGFRCRVGLRPSNRLSHALLYGSRCIVCVMLGKCLPRSRRRWPMTAARAPLSQGARRPSPPKSVD